VKKNIVKWQFLCFVVVFLLVFTSAATNAFADIIIDDGDLGTSSTGSWYASGGSGPYGGGSLYARPDATYTWGFNSQTPGYYEVFMWWSLTDSRASNIKVDVNTSTGPVTVAPPVDQTQGEGQWNSLGTYLFNSSGSVTITAASGVLPDGRIVSTCADAVRFVFQGGSTTYTITATAGANGTISPSGDVTVNEGADQAFSIEPSPGYQVADVLVDGSSIGAVTSHTFTSVYDNHTIDASFEPGVVPTEIIIDDGDLGTSSTGSWYASGGSGPYGGGSLYARPDATYTWGFNSQTPGYYEVFMWWSLADSRASNIKVDVNTSTGPVTVAPPVDQTQGEGQWNSLGTYLFNSSGSVTITAASGVLPDGRIVSTCADAVRFVFQGGSTTYTITATAGANGTISPSGDVTVNEGADQAFSIEPSPGYQVADVLVDGSSVGALTSHTFTNINDNHTIDATFVAVVVPDDIIIDNGDLGTSSTGSWYPSGGSGPYGGGSLYARPNATYTWGVNSQPPGYYEVFMWWSLTDSRASNIKVDVNTSTGPVTVAPPVDQTQGEGQWNSLGTYLFNSSGSVTITAASGVLPDGRTVSTCADAVRFRYISASNDHNPPVANFSATQTTGGVPFTVQFSDQSFGNIDEWLWDFGDGQTSTEENPTHEFTAIGTYTIALTVTNSYGTDTMTKESYIEAVNSLENIYVVDAYGSSFYVWQGIENMLQQIGATNDNGLWRYYNPNKNVEYFIREVKTVQGYEQALKEEGSHVIYSGHSNYGLGGTFVDESNSDQIQFFDDDLFSNYSTDMVDPDPNGMKFGQPYPNWKPVYKNGESAIMPYDFGDPRGLPPYNYYLTYTLPGDPTHYKVELADGSNIERFPDSGAPAWYAADGSTPDPIQNPEYFIINPSDDFNKCEFTGYWAYADPGDWHDGINYLGYNYQYHNPGTGANKATFTLVVKSPGLYAVIASWYADASNASNAKFTIQHADMGAGEYSTVVVDQRESELMNMLDVYYYDEGVYTVEITDDADGTVIADAVMLQPVDGPQSVTRAEFSADLTSGTSPHTVQFIDGSTVYISGSFAPQVSWHWDFGDGVTSESQNPTHTYTAPGNYSVSLTVTDELGDTDTEVKEGFIVVDSIANLHAEFTAQGLVGQEKAVITFQDQSSGNITSWHWDFGDGTESIEPSPIHKYTTIGSFTVTLTVSGPDGNDSESEVDFVYNTNSMVIVDNTFQIKPHYYRNYSGFILGSVIMDASQVTIPSEDLKYSRLFMNACYTYQYYLGKFNRGVVFYTLAGREEDKSPTNVYLREYLLGRSDDEILRKMNEVYYIHGYYDFNKLPPSMR